MNADDAAAILVDVTYPDYTFYVRTDGRGEMFLQAGYWEVDIDSPSKGPQRQLTRRWFISPQMSRGELVQTALKCVLTSAEHRVREHFKYRNRLLYGPHMNIDALWEAAGVAQDKREF